MSLDLLSLPALAGWVALAIIILFTHPMMEWIVRFRFFGEGHRLSGLDPEGMDLQAGDLADVIARDSGASVKARSIPLQD